MIGLKYLRYVLWLLFSPGRLIEAAADETIQRNFKSRDELPAEKTRELASLPKKQVQEIRSVILKSLLLVAGTFLLAYLPAGYSGKNLIPYIRHMQAISAFLILWSIFGKAGWSIQTLEGDTIPEKVNDVWFRLLTWLGIYLLVLSLLV